jgi:DNA-binding MarR family transcriptional regulator
MTVNYKSVNLVLRLWFLLHRTRDVVRRCEDQVFAEYELTTEQYAVLSVMKSLGTPLRVIDLARGLEREPNSVSMMVDRMVKAGLVRRSRDRGDRRTVYLDITSKGENALKLAVPAGLESIQEILSPLSDEDRRTLISLLEMVRYRALEYLQLGVNAEEMMRTEITSQAGLGKRLIQYISTPIPEAKHQGGKKRKTA